MQIKIMVSINYSIIIPHYHIPKLLVRCLKSIPIRPDIQVIVVDDCSPGADSYFDLYPEFKRPYLEWYSTPRGGSAGRARNIGLDHAKGKWVICLDADDLLVDNVEDILEQSINREEDILFYNYISVYSDNLNKKGTRSSLLHYFEQYKIIHDESPFRYLFDPIWCKIIRRNMIEKYHIRCDETRFANDASFSLQIGYHANNIAIIDKPLFIITQRNDSLASSYFTHKKMSYKEKANRMEVALKSQHFLDVHGVKIELPHFNNLKPHLINNNISFLLLITKNIFKYPNACLKLLSYWGKWKIRAIKNLFANPF